MTKRRSAPGQGSITERKDGLYMVRFPIPRNAKGQIQGCEYARTLREAQQKLRAAITRREQGLPEPERRLTVKQYLTDWLENSAKPSVRPTTFRSYESLTRVHLIPALGHHLLIDLTPRHVQAHMTRMQGQGLSPRSIQYQRAILRRALNQAVRWGMVSRNVAALVDSPKLERKVHAGIPIEHVKKLLTAIQGTRYEALICVTLCFGLRRGEALGLRWADVDFEVGHIRIEGQVLRIDGKVERVATTKSGKVRIAPIPHVLIPMLRSHRDKQLFYSRAHANRFIDHDLVFPSLRGTPMEPRRFNTVFTRILAQAGLPHYRIHDMRHSTVGLLRSLSIPDSVIMSIVGHQNLSMTHSYGDVIEDLKADALDKMGGLLFGN